MKKKKILICGAGCIGIYLGTMLASRNHTVTLYGRRKLKSLGESVKINNKLWVLPKKVFTLPLSKIYDIIFITTKLYDLKTIVCLIKKNKLKAPMIVSIQNGLVDNKPYEKIINNQRLIIISVFEGFHLVKNNLIVTTTKSGWKVGSSAQGKQISALLKNAGIRCTAEKRLESCRAEKTIVNCCLNALSAIEHKQFCTLFSVEKTRRRIENIFDECYAVLKQEYALDPAKIIKNRMYKTWSSMHHYSSTYQDISSKRKTEIDFLNGFIVSVGKKHHIPTPENKRIIEECKRIRIKENKKIR